MSQELQLAIVGAFVLSAALFVARSSWKAWFGKASKGCGAGCGKCTALPEVKPEGRFPLPQL